MLTTIPKTENSYLATYSIVDLVFDWSEHGKHSRVNINKQKNK